MDPALDNLLRRTLADLRYTPTLQTGELTLAREALEQLPAGTLLVGDRLFGTPKSLGEVQEAGLFAVFRRQNWAKVQEEEFLGQTEIDDGVIDDFRVTIGDRAQLPARLVRVTRGKDRYEFIMNVLDPAQLPTLNEVRNTLAGWRSRISEHGPKPYGRMDMTRHGSASSQQRPLPVTMSITLRRPGRPTALQSISLLAGPLSDQSRREVRAMA